MKLNDILDKSLRGFLVISFVFGFLQFFIVALLTLFGMCFSPYQYGASVVLMVIGIFGLRAFLNLTTSDEEA